MEVETNETDHEIGEAEVVMEPSLEECVSVEYMSSRDSEDGRHTAKSAYANMTMPARFARTSASAKDLHSDDESSVLITEMRQEEPREYTWEGMRLVSRLNARSVDSIEEDDVSVDEDNYDTDLEEQEVIRNDHDPTGRRTYAEVCEKLGVIPVSYFVRHITDPEVVMRYHGLGPDGTKAIAKVLKSNINTEKLNLSGNWMEADGGYHVARMLMENEYIADLILCDNKLGSMGGYHLAKMLHTNTALRYIDLSGNEFEDPDAMYFANAIEENRFLKGISLSRNAFAEEAGNILGPAIGANDVLERINLSWNRIRLSGAVSIARGLKENVRLKVCNLSWNGFGSEGGAALADAIASNESLVELDISGNRLDLKTTLLIAAALRTNEVLQTLKMGNNPITTSGCIALGKSINESEASAVTCLDLKDIPVEYEFVRIVEQIKKHREGFSAIHGFVLRVGNTHEDIGKPAVDPSRKDPMLILKEHLVVNDMRILDILKGFDPDATLSVTSEQFASALEELGVPYTHDHITLISKKLAKHGDGRIYYGDILKEVRPQNAAGGAETG